MTTKVEDKPEVQKTESEVKPLELNDIAQLGYIKKTTEVFKGVTLTLQTLSAAHHQTILSKIPTDSDALVKFTQLQVETLAHATVAINNKAYSAADVDFLRGWYGSLQSKVLQEFYATYNDLVEEQDKVLTSLKKN